MPYVVKGKCVYKTDGTKVKCHPTRQKAIKHMQALNINVTKPELKKKVPKKKAAVIDFHGNLARVQKITTSSSGLTLVPKDGLFEAEIAASHLASKVIDKAMASEHGQVFLVTIPDVPIVEAGVEYQLSTGLVTFTREDLEDMVTAANEDPSIPTPRFKLGHIDPRFNGKQFDATPAFGKFINLRLDENHMTIYADHAGAPKWLADILPAAYPSRSIEAFPNISSTASDTKWRYVLAAVGALGINWPGIRQLEDLPMYFGEDKPDDVEVVVAAGGGGVSMAAANLDDVRRAFYNNHIPDNAEMRYWWIRAVLTDPNQLIVENDEDGQLYQIPFKSDAKGEVTFSDAKPVRVDYVEDTSTEVKKAAAPFVAAGLAAEHKVAASWSSRAESRPANATQEEGAMDRETAIKKLGLPEDVSDEQIQAALSEMIHAFEPENPTEGLQTANAADPSDGGDEDEATDGDDPSITPQLTRQQIAAASAKGKGDKPTITLDRASYDVLMKQVKLGVNAHEKLVTVENDKLLDEAMAAGKFPPARRDAWEKYLQTDPEGAKAALAELQPGLVPVSEIGHGGGSGDTEEAIIYPIDLFPEVKKRKEREALIASGHMAASRIQTDGNMRRVIR